MSSPQIERYVAKLDASNWPKTIVDGRWYFIHINDLCKNERIMLRDILVCLFGRYAPTDYAIKSNDWRDGNCNPNCGNAVRGNSPLNPEGEYVEFCIGQVNEFSRTNGPSVLEVRVDRPDPYRVGLSGSVRYGSVRHGSTPHGSGSSGSVRYGSVRHGSTPHGSGSSGSVRYGSVRHGSTPYGSGSSGSVRHGSTPYGSGSSEFDSYVNPFVRTEACFDDSVPDHCEFLLPHPGSRLMRPNPNYRRY